MDLVSVYKKVVTDPAMSWVLFKHGTCVMMLKPQDDINTQAIRILQTHGSVIVGTPSGDFTVTKNTTDRWMGSHRRLSRNYDIRFIKRDW